MPQPSDLEPIAIVGIGCRLPGGADGPEEFWKMLLGGVDAIREVPPSRWDVRHYYAPEQGRPGRTYSKWAGLIEGIDLFDPGFFGITQREAPFIDPQQRLLLTAVWEALMDGGQQVDIAGGQDTGVFVGISTHDYHDMQIMDGGRGNADPYSATGCVNSIAANRISYALNFQGPSVAVDTACSSSLVAVHLACRALWNRECRSAVAAGVNCIISPTPFVAFSSMSMLSPDGRCKAFDASANGFVRGEGVGAVCLKPLSAAQADGDSIYAVIRSTAVNQDGRTSGMTVPSRGSQQEIIAEACRLAGVSPQDIQYAEAHGTGTAIGDLVEGSALGTILGVGRKPGEDCLVGSVKTNIGHLEAGSGIAGLIKVALSLKHRLVPPNLHFKTPNPSLNFERLRLKVVTEPTPLKTDAAHPLLACINSFGFGGTNAHAVLEAAPAWEPAPASGAGADEEELLPLSARGGETALKAVAARYRSYLEQADAALPLKAICAAASRRRTHHELRLVVQGRTRAEMMEALEAFGRDEAAANLQSGQVVKNPRLAFVFSGQGPQWWGMGRELMASEPVFRQTLQTCHDELLKLGGWSLLEELGRDEADSRLDETHIAQVAIFAIQAGLAALLASWGIRPSAVVGHSMGEVAAAFAAGVIDLPTAVRIIHHRGRCMEQTPLRGKMIAAGISRDDAVELLARFPQQAGLAAVNGPNSVSISGDAEAVDAMYREIEARGVFVREVPVRYAFHSFHMDPVQDELLASLAGLQPHEAEVKIFSTVTGRQAEGMDFDAAYWWRNVRQSVLFAPAIQSMIEAGFTHFVEISPHPVLSNVLAECLAKAEATGLVVPSLRRQKPERARMLAALGMLHVNGHAVDWAARHPEVRHEVRLPDYPWQKERYWHEPLYSYRERVQPGANHLLYRRIDSVHPTWETLLNKESLGWLKDHRVGQHIIFPGAGYVAMALAAGRELHPDKPVLVEELEIHRGCILPAGHEFPVMQIACLREENTFVIQSTPLAELPVWTQHVTGRVRAEPEQAPAPCFDLEAIRQRCTRQMEGAPFYEAAAAGGLQYGAQFRGLKHVWSGDDEALGRIEVPAAVAAELEFHVVHPALLDACIHPTIALPADGLYLPSRMERVRCYGRPEAGVWAYVRRTRAVARKIIVIDLFILNDEGRTLLCINDFVCKHTAMSSAPGSGAQADWIYAPQWQLKPLPPCSAAPSPAGYLPDTAQLAARLREDAATTGDLRGLNRRFAEWEDRFDQLCRASLLNAFKALGWRPKTQETVTLPGLMKRLKAAPGREPMLQAWLGWLEKAGVLTAATAEVPTWTVVARPESIQADKIWRDLLFHFPAFHPELILLDRCSGGLAASLRGPADPAHLPSVNMREHVESASVFTLGTNQIMAAAVAAALSGRPEGRPVRILEIGAGTGGVTTAVLPHVPRDSGRYVCTDTSDSFFEQAAQKCGEHDGISWQVFDPSLPPAPQELAGQHDIVLISNTMALAADVGQSLAHLRELLAPGGLLVMAVCDRPSIWHDLVLGTDARWWQVRHAGPWQQILQAAGLAEVECVGDASHASRSGQTVLLAREPLAAAGSAPSPTEGEVAKAPAAGTWLIFADAEGTGSRLATALRQRGENCVLISPANAFDRAGAEDVRLRVDAAEDYAQLFTAAPDVPPLRGVVHLWSLNAPAGDGLDTAALAASRSWTCHSPLLLLQALKNTAPGKPPQVCFVTRGAQPAGRAGGLHRPAAAPLHGLVRVAMSEMPELRCRTIDLDPLPGTQDVDVLLSELLHADAEDEVAWRGEARHAMRLVRRALDEPEAGAAALREDECFRLESARPGALDKLVFRRFPRRPPGPGELEIEVHAAALNFRDVMKALGIYPAEAEDALLLGDECAGVVVRTGEGVTDFKPGDEVMALATGAFSSHVTTVVHAVLPKPARLSMDEAATMMVTYLTASYALLHQGRMTRGERVLIHAGTGGVGQAAVRLSQSVGAEIFATAGSTEKRDFLRKMGVRHVFDSRSLAFAGEIRDATDDQGVDLVLNSLAGEAIHQSLSLLRQYGRFLEIGKRDIYGNTKMGLFPFRKNLSYHAIDLGHALDPKNARPLLRSLRRLITGNKLPPLPFRTFGLTEASRAFRYITQARQIGKVVLAVKEARPAITPPPPDAAIAFHPDATYLVAGGLGGFGMALAVWLVEKGARHIVLTSRSGSTTEESRAGIEAMQAAGAVVKVIASDVSQAGDVAALFDTLKADHPPVRSIFHVAMVLDDGFIPQLDIGRIEKVAAPKIDGAWNLHRGSAGLPLDHFVMFSSVASLIGSPGQANYAAANAFLDALAAHRQQQGLPALTVNWGVMAGVGYVARHKKLEEHFERIGWAGITPEQALPILGRLLRQSAIRQTMVSRIDWAKWAAVTPKLVTTPRYEHLTGEEALNQNRSEDAGKLREAVQTAAPEEQLPLIMRFLAEQVAKVLRIPAAKIDPRRPLNEIGVDSLMAVELIHQVESQSGIAIPTSQLMSGAPSVQKLAELLHVNIMGGQVESAAPAATVGTAADFVQDASLERSGITFAGGDISPAQIEDPQVIFLTGVHDFLGAHLLAGLLRHTRAEVRCLTSEQDAAVGMRAIQDHLTLHQCWEEAFTDRIRPVPGDLARPLLGLSPKDFATLAAEVDMIHHATAHISHIASYQQLRDINVGGTVEIIRLAATTRRKPVHYLSSISVLMARHPGGTELREDAPLPNHAALTVGYNQSRWVSEQLFLRAREQGIPVNLYRPGLLAGDIRNGIGPSDDVIWRFLKTCIQLGAGPRASYNTLLTPVDYVAAAMVRLSLGQHHGGRTYNLINPASPDFGDLLDLTAACGYPVRVVNEEEWEAVLTGSSLSLQDNPIAAYLMFIPRDVLSLLLREKSAEFCRNALDDLAGTGITCPPVDRELMQLYLAHFVRSGAFPPPATPPAAA